MTDQAAQLNTDPNALNEVTTARSPSHTFVSHSGQDREFVGRFVDDLRSIGIDAWYSPYEIKAGDSIPEKMAEGLQACRFFILVVSTASVASPYVQKEMNVAIARKAEGTLKKIICVKLDGTAPPMLLTDLKWVDAQGEYAAALKETMESIFDIDLRTPLGKPPADLDEGK